MPLKKAIVIILVLFFIIFIVFAFLYYAKSPIDQLAEQPAGNNVSTGADSQAELTPVEQKIEAIEAKTSEKIGQIIEQGQTATGGVTGGAQKAIEDAVNREIAEKLELKTPEQIKADEERQAELDKLDKIEQEINLQIIDQLKTR